jgi:hypothetical protein
MLGIPDMGSWGVLKQVALSVISDAAASSNPLTLSSLISRVEVEGQRMRDPSKLPGPGSEYANVVKETKEIRKHKGNPNGILCSAHLSRERKAGRNARHRSLLASQRWNGRSKA